MSNDKQPLILNQSSVSVSKLKRMQKRSAEMYATLDALRRVVFVNGGIPDEIMEVATEALRLVRIIDNDLK